LCGNPGIAEMIAHHRLLYADLADPLKLLRSGGGGGALQRFWHYAAEPGVGPDAQVTPYSALMAASQPLIADQVIDAYRFARHHRVLDVGGGAGAFLGALRAREPGLGLALFDLPAVAALAAKRFAKEQAVTTFAGDFLCDPLPPDFDLITLVRIVHDHDDAPALTLLRAVHAALPARGRLLIAEPMAGTRGSEPGGDAYFGFYLLALDFAGSGRFPRLCRSP
jgi:demethylspheroidene O-methyltransferase